MQEQQTHQGQHRTTAGMNNATVAGWCSTCRPSINWSINSTGTTPSQAYIHIPSGHHLEPTHARRACTLMLLQQLPHTLPQACLPQQLTCMLNTRTTVWPRSFCSFVLPSARSLAEDAATGNSPPTCTGRVQHSEVWCYRHMKHFCDTSLSTGCTGRSGQYASGSMQALRLRQTIQGCTAQEQLTPKPKIVWAMMSIRNKLRALGPVDTVSRMPPAWQQLLVEQSKGGLEQMKSSCGRRGSGHSWPWTPANPQPAMG